MVQKCFCLFISTHHHPQSDTRNVNEIKKKTVALHWFLIVDISNYNHYDPNYWGLFEKKFQSKCRKNLNQFLSVQYDALPRFMYINIYIYIKKNIVKS